MMTNELDVLQSEGTALEGFENVVGSDYALPMIKIVQRMSTKILDECPGIAVGSLYNTVSGESYDGVKGLLASLCFFQVRYVEMVPLAEGGGVVRFHEDISGIKIVQEGKMWMTPDGTQIVQSNYHFVRIFEPEILNGIIIMSGKQIAKSKRWLSMARSLNNGTEAIYKGLYNISVRDEASGNFRWKGWDIKFSRSCDENERRGSRALYIQAHEAGKDKGRYFPESEVVQKYLFESCEKS